ncbi:MAG: tripartite tricarboxylate transporter substrate-binding protein [Burkholderiales bacterium]|nr:tripartite tricarboxylate transporter substrate-binding protein [Burkholderiales bacterium]
MTFSTTRRQALTLAAGAAAAAALPRSALAQSLPTGTIRMLVGYPAGGGTDVMGRIIAEKLKERLGANVIVENRVGASGALACEAPKNAPADGSVIMYAPSAATVAQKVTKKSQPYDLEKDLATIGLTGTVSTVFVVSPTLGVRSLPEYIEWLKKNPRRASFGSTAMGSSTHFFGVEIGQAIGIALEPVAYKGAAPLIADLSAGHAPAGCGGLTDFLTHHRGDKLRIIAISAPKRATAAPDLPTITELGYPKLASEGFYGFYAPGKMSPALINAWNKELRAVVEAPEMRQRLIGLGLEVQTSTPAEFAARQSRDLVSFAASMKAAGFEPE